jgi:hypothetical protein
MMKKNEGNEKIKINEIINLNMCIKKLKNEFTFVRD